MLCWNTYVYYIFSNIFGKNIQYSYRVRWSKNQVSFRWRTSQTRRIVGTSFRYAWTFPGTGCCYLPHFVRHKGQVIYFQLFTDQEEITMKKLQTLVKDISRFNETTKREVLSFEHDENFNGVIKDKTINLFQDIEKYLFSVKMWMLVWIDVN